MRVTIEGTLEQVHEAVKTIDRTIDRVLHEAGNIAPVTPRRPYGAYKQRQKEIMARRNIVRSGYDAVRHTDKKLAGVFAGALSGRLDLSQDILDAAASAAGRTALSEHLPTSGGETG